MKFVLCCVLAAVCVAGVVFCQPPGYQSPKLPEFVVCGMTVVGACVAPELADYMRLGDPMAVMKKIRDDELRVVCNKIETASTCLKKNVPKYCKLGSTDALEEVNDLTALILEHVCKNKYTIFNKGKNCKIDKFNDIMQKMAGCDNMNISPPAPDKEPSDDLICDILKDKGFKCRVNVLGEVCTKEYGDEVKSFLKQAADNLFKCKNVSARQYSESNLIASSFLKRALMMNPAEAMENLLALYR